MARTRQPVKALNQSPAQIAANAAAEKARKAASRAALKAAKAAKAESAQVETPSTQALTPKADHAAEDAANALRVQREDWEALGSVGTFEAYLADQGLNPDGTVKPESKSRYDGPMLPLVAARTRYVKAANGIQCNGSPLAMLCGQFTRPVVVAALIQALKLPGNPYAHLNPGQQSMNLRNKARGAIQNGTLTMAEIEAALNAAKGV